MGIIIAIIVGGLAGWIASMLMNRDAETGILGNIVIGIIGAFLANLLLAPIFGEDVSLSDPSLAGFLLAIGGAVVLLAVVNLFTRRSLR